MLKIAIPTDDGKHISDAFGHAHFFYIFDADGEDSELRHNDTIHSEEAHESEKRHHRANEIAQILKDVSVIITSHMGKPMIDKLTSEGKSIYIAPKGSEIDTAIKLFFEGKLKKLRQNDG